MAARSREKEPPDLVHQNQIFCETVRKELRCQKLHTEYGVNPLKRVHTITRKPMSWHDNIEEPADVLPLRSVNFRNYRGCCRALSQQRESTSWEGLWRRPVFRQVVLGKQDRLSERRGCA
ncbi:cilia- and flagella-associated protein 144 isoform 2-T2 [Pangshura tecta]